MKISEMNWMQVETYLKGDDRAIQPIGSTEQHGYLSLSVDHILSERVSVEAAAPMGIPVFPGMAYGLTPYYRAFPGTISLKMDTLIAVMRDVLESMYRAGFRRVLIVNGHGGNQPVMNAAGEFAADRPGLRIKFHNWYNAPKTWKKVQEIDPVASHASWMENFPWTRLPNVAMPKEQKPMVAMDRLRLLNPDELRAHIGDGNYGGYYQRPDEDVLAIWDVAVKETRELLDGPWS
ncbi:MAG: creatininase family protein [Proteobacteria bacterium]|nr:creatininase family protein [Pseudomonadota bacterium]